MQVTKTQIKRRLIVLQATQSIANVIQPKQVNVWHHSDTHHSVHTFRLFTTEKDTSRYMHANDQSTNVLFHCYDA